MEHTLDRLPPGSRVALQLENGERLARLLLACFDRALVAVPLDPRMDAATARSVLAHADPAVVLTADGPQRREPVLPPNEPDDRFIVYTSGSTGEPKGVVHTLDAVRSNALAVAELHGLTSSSTHGTCLPLYHCNALMMSLLGCHLTGSKLVLLGRFDPYDYFDVLARHEASTAAIVPALLAVLLDAAPPWPESLRYLITAAAPLYQDQAQRFFDCYGPRLRQGYGLSEAVNFSFTMPELCVGEFCREYVDQWPPVGEPLPDTGFRLVDGEVQVRGPNLLRGYWREPQGRAETVTDDGYLRTGDTGHLRGSYLVLDGRRKETINRGGETLFPVAVEARWRILLGDAAFAAVAVADPVLHEEVGLIIDGDPLAACRALRQGGEPLPGWVAREPLALTATGKKQRVRMGGRGCACTLLPSELQTLQTQARAFQPGSSVPLLERAARCVAERRALAGTAVTPAPVLDADALPAWLSSQHRGSPDPAFVAPVLLGEASGDDVLRLLADLGERPAVSWGFMTVRYRSTIAAVVLWGGNV